MFRVLTEVEATGARRATGVSTRRPGGTGVVRQLALPESEGDRAVHVQLDLDAAATQPGHEGGLVDLPDLVAPEALCGPWCGSIEDRPVAPPFDAGSHAADEAPHSSAAETRASLAGEPQSASNGPPPTHADAAGTSTAPLAIRHPAPAQPAPPLAPTPTTVAGGASGGMPLMWDETSVHFSSTCSAQEGSRNHVLESAKTREVIDLYQLFAALHVSPERS